MITKDQRRIYNDLLAETVVLKKYWQNQMNTATIRRGILAAVCPKHIQGKIDGCDSAIKKLLEDLK